MVKLGQNFLADPNLLDAIVRDAGLSPEDVVLEVGAGEGVLTERLAEVASQVHVIELDRGLEPGLSGVIGRPNVNLVWADAVKYDLAGLDPAPTRMVANLPYAVATPVILRSAFELPSIESWSVMVQKEIGDRLRAGPGSKTYGAPSVLIQLTGEVRQVRKVSRTVFKPQPRVDSAIIRIDRTSPGPDEATRRLVRAGFAHRRKAMARSVDLAIPGSLRAVRDGLEAAGIDPGIRAEALSPAQFAKLSGMIDLAADD
ncbi:MAG TPA: 16S rRNA (adenine(1518)-N(6)/adenine(1519)-N(6))-dimethyltransferase RsmA [Solirubrobacterales bacterium]|nr:16S rRNA (adenine(1518)-N(6)/adenine(1519)-N(6))-dimethyltransferase RsmA [Solirubrobacterales bacterium]HNC05312.1 16S rRNA (adenine(1518)-N(6)/adenine(1519)-N(6))-dimethyltransferase RsmA [Solirubrobacterales bacterium]HNF82590.1 16S rRNA (adenine(1518)-N(6)/adenine(1519)-N(6))-dimethyltransferase RsmA [Solirubrobacterales bacterium]HNI40431.1 16S rRNA (adenine(1518)-N(6)/adenine(1519)-N(6))-dimethyltransferase RsmA [Solirubrobacterales bacterium]